MRLSELTAKKTSNQKILVPYITAGITDNWGDLVLAAADGGADAVEIGLPFSDPMIDGNIIQLAYKKSLDAGYNTQLILDGINSLKDRVGIPLIVMTYYNLLFARGLAKVAFDLSTVGVAGTIVPDLTIEELDPWSKESQANNLDNVLLVAPSTPRARTAQIANLSTGFIYALGVMGTTGIRDSLSQDAIANVTKIKELTDKPVLIGVGVSTPQQAQQAVQYCDGVIVGSALVKLILDKLDKPELPKFVQSFVTDFKTAIA